MDKKGELSVHVRPRIRFKKPIKFTDLPGEIRNLVYGYYFQEGFRCEFAARDEKLGEDRRRRLNVFRFARLSREGDTVCKPTVPSIPTVRFTRVLGQYERIQGLDTRWDTSLSGLIFVCKLVHSECISFLYASTTFVFDAPSRIANFLRVPRAANLDSVTKLQIDYHVYGDPKTSADIRWKNKHTKSWSRICKAAATRLVNLEHLDIWIHTRETNVRLTVREPYLRPISWFRHRSKALQRINVHINTIWNRPGAFQDEGLQRSSEVLHTLFGEAISRLMLGASVAVAMKDFDYAWNHQMTRWHHHLQFARTGW